MDAEIPELARAPKADDLELPPLPEGRFPCAMIDPPWHFRQRGAMTDPDSTRSPQKHYPTMSLPAIKAIPMREILTPNAFLFLWITGPLVAEGVHQDLAEAWGMRCVSDVFVWFKTLKNFDMALLETTPLLEQDLHMGTGYTSRKNTEYVFLLKRGKPVQQSRPRQVIISPVRRHSQKPPEVYRRVEAMCAGPRIDMFSGDLAGRDGWVQWGLPHREVAA